MKPGLSFLRTISGDAFLPRAEAEALPFSSNELMQILNRLSIPLDSPRAKEVEVTLHDCEAPAAAGGGERKYCATSLESMIDFVTSELKTRDIEDRAVRAAKMPGEDLVACHPEPYPHAVYYCHRTGATKAYAVPLVGKAATTVTAVAACHSDTKNWNPIFFKVLKVKPGTVLCHFLPQDHIIWTPSH
ncbi:BURP domain-containing protein 3-like [Typha angustifolia]|uniref:BURP domain-containing protein 3-like n=1 Tax=Typha angustifolia TaxID=59011 RepID=UPI003C30CE1F